MVKCSPAYFCFKIFVGSCYSYEVYIPALLACTACWRNLTAHVKTALLCHTAQARNLHATMICSSGKLMKVQSFSTADVESLPVENKPLASRISTPSSRRCSFRRPPPTFGRPMQLSVTTNQPSLLLLLHTWCKWTLLLKVQTQKAKP